jgi:hypothetical protein
MTTPSLKDLLLAPGARTEALVPPRGSHRHRPLPDAFDGEPPRRERHV